MFNKWIQRELQSSNPAELGREQYKQHNISLL